MPSVLQCSFLILFTKVSLRALGFGRTIKWIRKRVQLISENLPVDLEHIKAVEYSVAMAGALYPGRALCLEQSLVLYYLLKRQGVGVQYHHGVQFHPFRAHAWVEYRDMPINDVAEHLKLYVRLSAVLP